MAFVDFLSSDKLYSENEVLEPILEEFEKQLIGTRYDLAAVKNVLNNIKLSDYFGKISETDILDLLLRQE